MIRNLALHSRTKHIDTRFCYISDLVVGNMVDIEYCSMQDQLGDILKKSLLKENFVGIRNMLSLCDFELRGGVER